MIAHADAETPAPPEVVRIPAGRAIRRAQIGGQTGVWPRTIVVERGEAGQDVLL